MKLRSEIRIVVIGLFLFGGVIENSNCEKLKNFSEPCSNDDECQYDGAFLTCVDGACGCNPATSLYKGTVDHVVVNEQEVEISERVTWGGTAMYRPKYGPTRYISGKWLRGNRDRSHGFVLVKNESWTIDVLNQCAGLAGQKCNPEGHCVSHSTCVSGMCSCNKGFNQKTNGRCGAIHNNRCTLVMPCADGLVCVSGECKCPDAANQEFEKESQECLGKIHAFCSSDSDCVENSICIFNPNSGKNQCACDAGFLATPGRKCEKGTTIGSPCTYGGAAPFFGGDSCPGDLECRDGFCDCPDSSTVFHAKLRHCVGLVGSKCNLKRYDPNARLEAEISVVALADQHCVDGAFCEQHLQEFDGQCVCKMGYNYTAEGYCMPVYCNSVAAAPS